MRQLAAALLGALVAASCAGDPTTGVFFACDPDWQSSGGDDPCLPGCRCVAAPGGRAYSGVCVCGEAGFDFGASDGGEDAVEPDVPAPDGSAPDASVQDAPVQDAPEPDTGADAVDASGPDLPDTAGDPGFEELPDVCVPDCSGASCGQDGCGGTCGDCADNQTCVSGKCRPACWTAPCPSGFVTFDGCRCRIPPTGATQCRTDKGLVACDTIPYGSTYYGQDAHFESLNRKFTTTGPSTVEDQNTGLIWMQTVFQNQNLPGGATVCADTPSGDSNVPWRLPSLWESLSLMDFGAACPMWPIELGTSCPSTKTFWTVTALDDGDPMTVEAVHVADFGYGFAGETEPDNLNNTRCVRGVSRPVPINPERFTYGLVTAIDRVTGLEWQMTAEPELMDWETALGTCVALGIGWHVPSVAELASLLPVSVGGCPQWAPEGPSGTSCDGVPDAFWTSTPMPDQEGAVYTIEFGTRTIAAGVITATKRAVRCVRFNG